MIPSKIPMRPSPNRKPSLACPSLAWSKKSPMTRAYPRQKRKQLQIQTANSKSRRAKLLKIADKTSNLRSLVNSPPKSWTRKRKRKYCEWSAEVVTSYRGLNRKLDCVFDEALAAALEATAKNPDLTRNLEGRMACPRLVVQRLS